jgi:hypothetical protein
LHRNLNVLPRMYSLGCCRSFRMPLLPIISITNQDLNAEYPTRQESSLA